MRETCPECSRRVRLKKSRHMVCKCGHEFPFNQYFKGSPIVYLVDANILIYAVRDDYNFGSVCKELLTSGKFIFGTTEEILAEVAQEINYSLKVYRVKHISDELKELKANTLKQPSLADLSLIQAAIEHPEVKGIVTYDLDFKNVATKGIVAKNETFFVDTADVFLRKHGMIRAEDKKKFKRR